MPFESIVRQTTVRRHRAAATPDLTARVYCRKDQKTKDDTSDSDLGKFVRGINLPPPVAQLNLRVSAKLIARMGWAFGDRIDVLLDKTDRCGLLRRDPAHGVTLTRPDRKTGVGLLRVSRTDWRCAGTVELPCCVGAEDGEVMFEVPPEVHWE